MQNWNEYIEQRDPNSVWFVMVTSGSCPACQVQYPIFQEASIRSHGLIHFGEIRADQEHGIEMRLKIQYLPSYFIFYPNGERIYQGKRSARAMINECAQMIPDRTQPVQTNWLNSSLETAILFTNKNVTPPMWRALSCIFQGKLRMGYTNDQNIYSVYDVHNLPEIQFINKSSRITYSGKFHYKSLKNALNSFLQGSFENPFQFNSDFFLPEEFWIENEHFTGYSILIVSDILSPSIRRVKDQFSNNRLKFFYGTDNLPYSFMKPDQIWLIFQRKKMALQAQDAEQLKVFLTQIFDGTIVWKPISENSDLTSSL